MPICKCFAPETENNDNNLKYNAEENHLDPVP